MNKNMNKHATKRKSATENSNALSFEKYKGK
jgi:hypothetical protein